MPPRCWQLPVLHSYWHPQGMSPAAHQPALRATTLSTDPQTCRSLPWQHFTIYLNRPGAQCVPGKLLHSPPFKEDLSPGKEDNEAVFLLWLFKAVLSCRHGNGWIGLNELSYLSVKVRSVKLVGFVLSCKGIKWIWLGCKMKKVGCSTEDIGFR